MYKNLTNRITALLIGAILITIVTVSSVIVWMSAEHNRISAEDSIVRIDGGLRSLESSLKLLAIDYSWWQEAYDNINARNDEWVYSNMGISVVDSATAEVATVDLVYILSPAGAPIYGWVKDGGNASATDVLEPGVIADLREQLAQQPSDAPAAVIQFASVNDHLFLLSATRVMPTVFDEIDPATLPTSVMGYRLDTARISDLGKSFLTDDLMLSETIPPKFQSIALRSAKGETLGHLVWQASRPGRELLQKSALPIIIALGLFTLFGAIISRNARKIATALVDQNERTRRLLVMAEAANDAKTEFLGNITHELRTPMIGVIGTADILSTRDLSRQDKDLVEIVKFSGTSLLSLIDNILEYSKIEAGKIELRNKSFCLRANIERVVGLFQLATKDNDIRVYLNIDPDLPEFLVGDARRVAQMVNNLVDNAVKFTERGWVHVNVASQLVEGQAHLTISVKDTGIGIAKEKIPIIFEKFQQIDSSMSRKFEGAGLGLSITHWLTHLMGGTISVQSQPGNGSNFVICLALPVSERIVKLQPELSSFQSAMSSGRIG